ncbi:MAG TPA: exodeoxyribonuclease V subunit alpha [Luteimonas sp.]|nr:exodeoxyribonuclease V subunit alpha [Luteimonas sp.]
MGLMEQLRRQPALRTVDLALADVLRRRAPGTDERVLAAAALASFAVSLGHAAFDPAQPRQLLPEVGAWPEADAWRAVLAASPWVSQPAPGESADSSRPLVLEGGLLYLRRYREYERRLAARLQALARGGIDAMPEAIAPLFAALFPDADAGNLQAQAARQALLRPLLLVTGGPGTGKTTTITRLLLLLLAQARAEGRAPPRIALVAPTGRAADRVAESLRNAVARLRTDGIEPELCDALPTTASTLHRLLGPIPDSPAFRFNAQAPLPHDVVVVDEASMVDLPLMCKLVEAVADGARLILLGDRDQLPSVEAGDVLAAIGDAAGEGADSGEHVAGDDAARGPLHGHRVHLRRGYRQSDALDLAPLADAVRDRDAEAVLQLLREGPAGVSFHENLADPLRGTTRETLLAPWRALQALPRDPPDEAAHHDIAQQALALAARLRLLTALRDGPQGARTLNARIEELLAGPRRPPYFHGRLLLVNENNHRLGLFNGDIGVCLDGGDGVRAWFTGGDAGVRAFHPAALPAHDSAFAMTVHKAQGSEFDEVWLQLPTRDSRVLSRELVYTGITRARRALHVAGSADVIKAALARHATRWSGLGWRLAGESTC